MPRSDRLFALANILASPRRRRLDELAEELGASPRTIYRDLADLEARGVPIERVEGSYRLLDGATMRPLQLTPRERLLLDVALTNPAIARQSALLASLRALRSKLTAAGKGMGSAVAVIAGPDRSGSIPLDVLEPLEQAIESSHSVSILYTSLSTGAPEWRGIDPWVIFHRSEAWYLAGRCHVHDGLRTFRLDRISGVLSIGGSFVRPADFDVEEWLGRSWGLLDSAPVEAVIIFDAALRPLIEHGCHHATESKWPLEDGRLEYRVNAGSVDELAKWVTGFGGSAQAISPPVLVERVREISEGALGAHGQRKPARKSVGKPTVERRRA